jgi:hypothetical protein
MKRTLIALLGSDSEAETPLPTMMLCEDEILEMLKTHGSQKALHHRMNTDFNFKNTL